jgi:hypothetical protein
MRRFAMIGCTVAIAALALALPARAQGPGANGTPHGINLTWTAGAQGSDTNAVSGYNVYRTTGACSSSNLPGSTAINASLVSGTSYLDPAAGLAAGTTYCYGVATVDAKGNQSPYATTTVAVPSAGFPANPGAPGSLAGAVQ